MERTPNYIEHADPGDECDFIEKERERDLSFFLDRGYTLDGARDAVERVNQRIAFVTIFEDK